jgi:hypothetical protein
MPDSHLNRAEQGLQHSFMKSRIFNGLLMVGAVTAAWLPIRELPDRRRLPDATVGLHYRSVRLPPVGGPLRLAGAWVLEAEDRRLGAISALAVEGDRFLAVTDRGAVLRFHRPGTARPTVSLSDLRAGPGPFGRNRSRDAESLARDPQGRGWWVGYEHNHSLWLYDHAFSRALDHVALDRPQWWANRGAEGLLEAGDHLLVTAENGRDIIRVDGAAGSRLPMDAGADVAEAATAPDGSQWLLLRSKGIGGIAQRVAPLIATKDGYRVGPAIPVPKGAFDNYEGMVIEGRPDGKWRFWLVTDDGHRILARTLLVALDYAPEPRNEKSPARSTGLSK